MKLYFAIPAIVFTAFGVGCGIRSPETTGAPSRLAAVPQNPAERIEPGIRMRLQTQMNQVKYGMTKEQVAKLLGTPDLKREARRYDGKPNGIEWLYGTIPTDDFPILGLVRFDGNGKVEHHFPWDAPQPATIDEQTMCRGLRFLHASSGKHRQEPSGYSHPFSEYSDFNPIDVIKEVNAIVSLGAPQGLAILREFLRLGGNTSECTVNMVFEIPADPQQVPYYPYYLVDGIPLSPIPPHSIFGMPIRHAVFLLLDRLMKIGKMRTIPLRPTDMPWEIVEKLRTDSTISSNFGLLEKVQEQMLHLLGDVYPSGRYISLSPGHSAFAKPWEQMVTEMNALDIHWDENSNEYVLANGKTLPPATAAKDGTSRKVIWEPSSLASQGAKTVIERIDSGVVRVYLDGKDCDTWKLNIHLVGFAGDTKVLDANVLEGMGFLSTAFALTQGKRLRLVCESTKGTDTSPELSP